MARKREVEEVDNQVKTEIIKAVKIVEPKKDNNIIQQPPLAYEQKG